MIDVETFEGKAPEILLDLAKHIETELVSGFKASEEDAKISPLKWRKQSLKLGRRSHLYPSKYRAVIKRKR
ncbi:Uncharacterised protein [Actinobacillus equuli]|nr:Uncharacterised protein [Actinobacillus equuli]